MRPPLWRAAVSALLVSLSLLHCCCGVSVALKNHRADWLEVGQHSMSKLVNIVGDNIKTFSVNGVLVTEPRFSYVQLCHSVEYDYLYQKYILTLQIMIDVGTLKPSHLPDFTNARLGNVTLSELKVIDDAGEPGVGVSFATHLLSSETAQLRLMFDTFDRYRQLEVTLVSSPHTLQHALKFIASGMMDDKPVKFRPIESSNAPSISCPIGNWVVFQRRVDGSLSFVQNWDTYVKGFGDPGTNYWMGLEKLFFGTVTSDRQTPDSKEAKTRCRLRIDAQDFKDTHYIGEWLHFQVLEFSHGYRLDVGRPLRNDSKMESFTFQSGAKFSTYDRDNDDSKDASCSRQYGYGGWWFKDCHSFLLNGAYPVNELDINPAWMTIKYQGHWIPMKSSVMMFKCD